MRLALAALLVLAGCSRTGLKSDQASLPDAGVDAAPDCVEPDPPPYPDCVLEAPNASVRGDTPLGPMAWEHAWAGYLDGSCAGPQLVLGRAPRLRGELTPRPEPPWLFLNFFASSGVTEEASVTLYAPDCREASATARIEILDSPGAPGDDPRGAPGGDDGWCACDGGDIFSECRPSPERRFVRARIRVVGDGWDLEGMVRAPYCHALHGICF